MYQQGFEVAQRAQRQLQIDIDAEARTAAVDRSDLEYQ
jgi:uncharacterized lipoprotein YajG